MQTSPTMRRVALNELTGVDAAVDITAVEDFVNACLPRIRRFAAMVSPPGTDPDDLAQDACLRAIERAAQYDPRRGTVEAWVWRIAINLGRDAGRLARRSEVLIGSIAFGHGNRPAVSPETLALERIRDQDLVDAVRRLPRRYRTLIALRYGADLSVLDVARHMGLTRMATAKALRRALDRLRGDLAALEVDRDPAR